MVNFNDIFAYYTVKYAAIRDWKLGVLQKSIMFVIFIKILCLGMFYRGGHLLEVPVFGSARGNAQQPTKGGCNPLHHTCFSDFTPMSKLPYCTQYEGKPAESSKPSKDSQKDAEEDGKEKHPAGDSDEAKEDERRLSPRDPINGGPQGLCTLYDAPSMTRGRSPVPGTIFLPTRIVEQRQISGCNPSKSNGFACDTKPWVAKPGSDPVYKFVTEVERFTLLINQAFQSELPGLHLAGRAADFDAFIKGHLHLENLKLKHKGYIQHLESKLKQVAKLTEIPLQHPNSSSAFPSVFSLSNGDVLTVGDVLRMADVRGADLLDLVRPDGETMRSEGAVIDMSIMYDNVAKWDIFGNEKPHYTITCNLLPMRYYKIVYEETISDKERMFMDVHGLLIIMRVHGKIRVWSLTNILTYLTTALVSLAMASTVTDYMMMYLFKFSGKYSIIKYQPTQDFGHLSNTLSSLMKTHGDRYDPKTHKASPCSDVLNDCAEKTNSPPEGKNMLAVLLQFEQRLNRLDGMDDLNAVVPSGTDEDKMDPGAKWMKKFEEEYRRDKMGVPSRGPAE